MQTFELAGTLRDHIGRRASKDSRTSAMVPCVLYGDGENVHFEVAKTALKNLVYTHQVYKVMITVDGKQHEALMREIQFHKVTDEILHIDFFKLNPSKKINHVVPITLSGQSIGVKGGGKLVQRIRKITIKAFPKDLVDKVVVDITDLDVNKTIRVGDIQLANVEVLGSKSIPVVTVVSPRALKAAADAAAAADTKAAPAAAPAAKEEKKD
jgi:large subunit ribosomal protein L25